ncbi:MAG: protein kinase, partial [Simkania sp.]|nr:protein kinase [Simkania sp.]
MKEFDIVPCDLKPENNLFVHPFSPQEPLQLKVVDFGLSRFFEHRVSSQLSLQHLSGTPFYMAPEQFMGNFGYASDLYSLGVLLFEMVHATPPFVGSVAEIAQQHLYKTPPIQAKLPVPLQYLLTQLLAKEPTQRCSDIQECIRFIQQTQRHLTPSKITSFSVPPSQNPSTLENIEVSPSSSLTLDSFSLFPLDQKQNQFAFVSNEGIHFMTIPPTDSERINATSQFFPLPEINHFQRQTDGSLWVAKGKQVYRFHGDEIRFQKVYQGEKEIQGMLGSPEKVDNVEKKLRLCIQEEGCLKEIEYDPQSKIFSGKEKNIEVWKIQKETRGG